MTAGTNKSKFDLKTIGFSLVAILIATGFIFFDDIKQRIIKDKKSDEKDTLSIPVNYRGKAKEIADSIVSLRASKLDKSKFRKIEDQIYFASKNGDIKGDDTITLPQLLNQAYIKTLEDAAKVFFKSSTEISELKPINHELKEFQTKEMKPQYGHLVADIRGKIGVFYALYNYSKTQTLDVYSIGYNRIEEKINTISKDIENVDRYSDTEIIKSSPLTEKYAKEATKRLINNLKDISVYDLNHKIQGYSTQIYDSYITRDYKGKIRALKENKYLRNFNIVKNKCSEWEKLLEDHLSIHESYSDMMLNEIGRDSMSCEEVFTKFEEYVVRCNQGVLKLPNQ